MAGPVDTKPNLELLGDDERQLVEQANELLRRIVNLGFEPRRYGLASPFGVVPSVEEKDEFLVDDPRLVTLRR